MVKRGLQRVGERHTNTTRTISGDRGRSRGPREWGTGGGSEGAGSGGSVVLMLNVVLALQVTENELALS